MDDDHATFTRGKDGFVLRDRHHPFKRLFLGGAGLFAVVMPLWDFWPALRAPTGLSLFFIAIMLGAWSVGGLFLAGALFGDSTELRLERGRLLLTRKNPFRTRTEPMRPGDVSGVAVKEHDWESRAETYSVEIRLVSGKRIGSGDYATRASVEAIVAEIKAALAAAGSK